MTIMKLKEILNAHKIYELKPRKNITVEFWYVFQFGFAIYWHFHSNTHHISIILPFISIDIDFW